MQVINWLAIQPQEAEIQALCTNLDGALPARKLRQKLAEIVLQGCPWPGRPDLVPTFHPSRTYHKDQWLALLAPDPQKLRPAVWRVARVIWAEAAENPKQGRFQALTLDVHGKQIHVAGGVPDARFPESGLAGYTSEELAWLSDWVEKNYTQPLQAALEKLIRSHYLHGRFVGENFVPDDLPTVTIRQLEPLFAALSLYRPWVSVDDILHNLPDLSHLGHETTRVLIRSALDESSYYPLGGDRWTTQEIYTQLNREVPRGLPAPRIRSKLDIWTEQDEADLVESQRKPLPVEARQAIAELDDSETPIAPPLREWQPPADPVKLPTLNYLHITQEYFPVGHLIHAFRPNMRLVFIQFIDGEHRPFLLDREAGLLKALDLEILRSKILGDGVPAGTHLWLEYQGGDNYRIAPRPLAVERMVPCKLAYKEDGELHIEHTEISMRYEGDPSVFKADMRFSDIEALFAEARQVNLSLRDTIAFAIQKLCATDPQGRAHRLDIFNAVFLKRMCSPNSVTLLLYTTPCFEQLGGGYFRFNPSLTERKQGRPRKPKTKPMPYANTETEIRALIELLAAQKVLKPILDAEAFSSLPVNSVPPEPSMPEPELAVDVEGQSGAEPAAVSVMKMQADVSTEHLETIPVSPGAHDEIPEINRATVVDASLEDALREESTINGQAEPLLESPTPSISNPSLLQLFWRNLRIWLHRIFGGRHD